MSHVTLGARFWRLIVEDQVKGAQWRCRCDCGATVVRWASTLQRGGAKSCGCLKRDATVARNRKHGLAVRGRRSRTYGAWLRMRDRCNNPRTPKYSLYGGRGIRVCERWDDYPAFLADMGESPLGHSLDRIDVNGDYEPSNCRWATQLTQMQNVRRNKHVDLGGEVLCASEAARRLGIHYQTLLSRLRSGWSIERIAAIRPQRGNNHVTAAAG